ncbi:PREDICTED: uncharacterized protein LOC106818180, partial [Priapulus caudatus]|uniref:Uncharacterized protein LOC106818180 n=1 Tax=Priapulus caudatus TaxID=37621 RepID=A0ABM1F1S0_PRICU
MSSARKVDSSDRSDTFFVRMRHTLSEAVANRSERTESTRKEPMKEKLSAIDREIRTLHELCMKRGFSEPQISDVAAPLLQAIDAASKRRLLGIAARIVGFLLLVMGLFYINPMYNIFCVIGRKMEIKLLPVWDWTRYYYDDCIMNNPYYNPNKIYHSDCRACEDLEDIDHVRNVSWEVTTESYLRADVPVIVTDGIANWTATDLFSWEFLSQFYSTEAATRESYPCAFTSNVRVKYGNNRLFLKKAAKQEITKWFAYWENCERPAARTFRQFFRRPYFLPAMVEMAESNWLFLANNYRAKSYKEVPIISDLVWFAQVRGKTYVKLTPRSPCNRTCDVLTDTLYEGEI